MTHVPRETVKCTSCGRTFDKAAPDLRVWGGAGNYFAVVDRKLGLDRPTATCGDCLKLFMDWLEPKPTN
jgi:hypothetical protein